MPPSRPREGARGGAANVRMKQGAAIDPLDRSASPRRRQRRRWPQRSRRLNSRRMSQVLARQGRRRPGERAAVDPSTATARWPSSTPATLSSCGSEAARSSAGRTSQRRRLSTSRRSSGCLGATLVPARHRRLAPVAAARPPGPKGGQLSRCSQRSSSDLSQGKYGEEWRAAR